MRAGILAFLACAVAFARADAISDTEAEDDVVASTKFNGQTVPPLLELTPDNWNDEVNKTRWLMIKHYRYAAPCFKASRDLLTLSSPYCGHCLDFAPTFQTIYEFYYTSKSSDGTLFQKEYDFRFAIINCIAYSDLCSDHNVLSFPRTVLYDYGKEIEGITGSKDMETISAIVEKGLEITKPGSRPAKLALPEPGDTEALSKADSKGDAKEAPGKASTKPSAEGTEKDAKPAAKEAFGSDWKVPSAGDLRKSKEPAKSPANANLNGISVSFTAESFQKMVTQTQDAWFIKFYAPWCPHCQAMGPTWNQLAKTVKGKLNIGEVNCDKETRLCKDVHARAFPTLIFFKGGERVEYNGLRGLGDFVQFADKAVDLSGGVPDVNATSFKALEGKEEVIFIYFYDHATTSEDFLALEQLPMSLIGHAKLVKTNDPELYKRFKITTWPRLVVSREGRPTYYPPLTPDEMRDKNALVDWMRSVWLPLVPELNPSNAQQIMNGKLVVLGVLSHADQDEFSGSLREMKTAANEWMDRQIQEFQLERKKLRDSKQMRIEEAEDRGDQRALRNAKAIRVDMNSAGRREATFAWVDGVYWQRWIRTTYGIDVKDGERIIINDQDVSSAYRQRSGLELTNLCAEPPLLGPNCDGQLHHGQPHLHHGDAGQGHVHAARHQVQTHRVGD